MFPSRKKINHNITSLLNSLGSEASDVARSLRSAGCIGIRDDSENNPVAVYLAANLNNFDICVDSDYTYATSRFGHIYKIRNPRPVLLFLEKFNRGAYPDREPARA